MAAPSKTSVPKDDGIDAAKLEAALRKKLLPGHEVKAGPRAGARGLFDKYWIDLIVAAFKEFFVGRYAAIPRAKGEPASRGLSAESILDDFIDFLTSGLTGVWKDRINAALKLAGPFILDLLRGYTVQAVGTRSPIPAPAPLSGGGDEASED